MTCTAPPCLSKQCASEGRCLYKPSRQEFYEVQEKSLDLASMNGKRVEDFKGVVDGGGYKAVMDCPKTPIELIPPQFIEGIASVLQHGATKYAPNNWMRGMSWKTVFGSIMRHLWAWFRSERLDKESGLPHLYHAACGLMFLTFYSEAAPSHYGKHDDRVFQSK